MNTKMTIAIFTIAAITLSLGLATSLTSIASAAIHQKNTGCSNPGGGDVGGKTTCPPGKPLEQQSCNANSGANEKCPKGLNP
jgi:hypothetical protein